MKQKFISSCAYSKRILSSLLISSTTAGLLLHGTYADQQQKLEEARRSAQIAELKAAAVRCTQEVEDRTIKAQVNLAENIDTYTSGYVTIIESIDEPTIGYVETSDYSVLNVRENPDDEAEVIGKLEYGTQVVITNDNIETKPFVEIVFNSETGYIHSNFISETQPDLAAYEAIKLEYSKEAENSATEDNTTEYNQDENNDLVLNSYDGTVQGPSGKETYYNLNMSHVVEIMHDMGVEGEYWVRDDGVKMLGSYIMVAANLDLRPRGTVVETSLGKALVCDTGDFAASNATQLDIATTW